MKTFMIVASLLALSTSVYARVFETIQECDKRYGKPTAIDRDGTMLLILYEVDDVDIFVSFLKVGESKEYTAVGVAYMQSNKKGGFEALTVATFLKANSQGKDWRKVDYLKRASNAKGLQRQALIEKAAKTATWIRSDQKVVVYSSKNKHFCSVETEAYHNYVNNKKASKF